MNQENHKHMDFSASRDLSIGSQFKDNKPPTLPLNRPSRSPINLSIHVALAKLPALLVNQKQKPTTTKIPAGKITIDTESPRGLLPPRIDTFWYLNQNNHALDSSIQLTRKTSNTNVCTLPEESTTQSTTEGSLCQAHKTGLNWHSPSSTWCEE